MRVPRTKMKEKTRTGKKTRGKEKRDFSLNLFNDDVHSFEYVIESLIDVCMMDNIQAEQCTFIAHYKGKCNVKKGSLKDLKPMKEGLIERKLICSID